MKVWKMITIVLVVALACGLMVACSNADNEASAQAVANKLVEDMAHVTDLTVSEVKYLTFKDKEDSAAQEVTMYIFEFSVNYTSGGTRRSENLYYSAVPSANGFTVHKADSDMYQQYTAKKYKSKESELKSAVVNSIMDKAKADYAAKKAAADEERLAAEEAERLADANAQVAAQSAFSALWTSVGKPSDFAVSNVTYLLSTSQQEGSETIVYAYVLEISATYSADGGEQARRRYYYITTIDGEDIASEAATVDQYNAVLQSQVATTGQMKESIVAAALEAIK